MTSPSTDLAPRASSRLTGDQLSTLRPLLIRALADQGAQLEQNEVVAASLTVDGDDDVGDREMARLAADRAREAMSDIEHALGRFEDGTYGACATCEQTIPFGRLEAIPQARHCVGCSSPGGLIH